MSNATLEDQMQLEAAKSCAPLHPDFQPKLSGTIVPVARPPDRTANVREGKCVGQQNKSR